MRYQWLDPVRLPNTCFSLLSYSKIFLVRLGLEGVVEGSGFLYFLI